MPLFFPDVRHEADELGDMRAIHRIGLAMPERIPGPELDLDTERFRIRVTASVAPAAGGGLELTVTLTDRSTGAPAGRTLVGLHLAKDDSVERWTDGGRVAFPAASGPVTLRIHADPDTDLALDLSA